MKRATEAAARYAVMGHPIEHSRSPEIHSAFAAQFDIPMRYERRLAPKDGFEESATGFFMEGGRGLNVTVPFKEAAFAWLEQCSPSAQNARAVNTIVQDEAGALCGHNTDGEGLVTDLTRNLGWALAGQRLLVVGAGGAVAGALGPLLEAKPAALVLTNRTRSRADALAERFPGVEVAGAAALRGPFDLVVNATAVGLGPETGGGFAALVPAALLEGARCYDMLYGPQASFSAYAAAAGAERTADGLGMLVEQAAVAFTLWHGAVPDTAPVMKALRG